MEAVTGSFDFGDAGEGVLENRVVEHLSYQLQRNPQIGYCHGVRLSGTYNVCIKQNRTADDIIS
jgi:hypothetical protein